MTSTAEPPSTVGPSASVSETTIPRKRVDFNVSHHTGETTSNLSQRDILKRDLPTTRIHDRSTVIPRSTTTMISTVDSSQQRGPSRSNGGEQLPDATSLEVMDMDVTTIDHDIFHGIYPDFQLPLPNRPYISGTSTSSSTVSNLPTTYPFFNIHRVDVGATSSVSSLEEGEGILTDDEYERAVHRIEKINKKITTLIRNWHEESKSAKTSSEVVEIDEFYRTYRDQYNARRKALERLMGIYEEYYKDTTPVRASQQEHSTD